MIGGSSIANFRARGQPDANDWTCALLAGTQLQEIGLGAINKRDRTPAIAARVADWLAASLPVHPDEGGMPAPLRAQSGDVLAALGDPRFDPERSYLPADDMLGFVRIPADPEFRIGTPKADAKRVAGILGAAVPDHEMNECTDTDAGVLHRPLSGHGRPVQGLRRGNGIRDRRCRCIA